MVTVLNIVLIGLVGLIAYWWANQGLFSALLHLLCVFVAGAITLAFWEPLATMTMTGGGWDNYAWGVTFLGLFSITLFVLRLLMDKLVPSNVNVPHWASLTFGGAAGAAAGVITIGMFTIGAGFIQSHVELLGYRGTARSKTSGKVEDLQKLWLPFNQWTSDLYSAVSIGSMSSGRPLARYNPELWRQSTLIRDTFRNGKGQLALAPDAATVRSLQADQKNGRYAVQVAFSPEARDHGEQLTLASSQIRMIGREPSGTKVYYPDAWQQPHSGRHLFDDVTHYASSLSGQGTLDAVFEFQTSRDFAPEFIQIRNTRYRLPDAQSGPIKLTTGPKSTMDFNGARMISTSYLRVTNSITPLVMSTNTMPSGLKEIDRLLTEGKGEVPRQSGSRPSRQLRILGIYEPEGTRCVQLQVKREGVADLYAIRETAGGDGIIALVDIEGNEYYPIGYIWRKPDITFIELQPKRYTRKMTDLPNLPTSGDQNIDLIFYVTTGVTIKGVRLGDVPVGQAKLLIPEAR